MNVWVFNMLGPRLFCGVVLFGNQLAEEGKASCFILFVFYCHAAVYRCYLYLPHRAMEWSVVCDCGISWSYSFAFI